MFGSDPTILTIAKSMVSHATSRQAVLAENIAHADTPGYRAKDVASFAEVFRGDAPVDAQVDRSASVKPTGNSVHLEDQVMYLAEARGQHEMALAMWEKMSNFYQLALRGSR